MTSKFDIEKEEICHHGNTLMICKGRKHLKNVPLSPSSNHFVFDKLGVLITKTAYQDKILPVIKNLIESEKNQKDVEIHFSRNNKGWIISRIIRDSNTPKLSDWSDEFFSLVFKHVFTGETITIPCRDKFLVYHEDWKDAARKKIDNQKAKKRRAKRKAVTVCASKSIKNTNNQEDIFIEETEKEKEVQSSIPAPISSTSVLEYKKSEKSYLEERYTKAFEKLEDCNSRISALENEIKKLQEEKSHLDYLIKHFE